MSAAGIYAIVAVVAVALIVGVVLGSMMLWRSQVRRSLIGLTGRREAIRAAYRALESVFSSLAGADADELTTFAMDAGSVHRKALEELHARMRIMCEEIADLPLPKALWPAADLLGVAAGSLAVETGRVGEATSADKVLEALGKIDVIGIANTLGPADVEIDRLLGEYQVEDPAVYGGGMYI